MAYAKQTSTRLARKAAEGAITTRTSVRLQVCFQTFDDLILQVFVGGTQHYFDEVQRSCRNHATNKQTITSEDSRKGAVNADFEPRVASRDRLKRGLCARSSLSGIRSLLRCFLFFAEVNGHEVFLRFREGIRTIKIVERNNFS